MIYFTIFDLLHGRLSASLITRIFFFAILEFITLVAMNFRRFLPGCMIAIGCGVYGLQQLNSSLIMSSQVAAAEALHYELQNKRL